MDLPSISDPECEKAHMNIIYRVAHFLGLSLQRHIYHLVFMHSSVLQSNLSKKRRPAVIKGQNSAVEV